MNDALKEFFLRLVDGLKADADAKGQKIPLSTMHFEVDENSGKLYAAHYFQYLILGRGPGGFPPPQSMTDWVEKNPDVLERARQIYKYITAQQLGFLIGRKIAREGTDIYQGKKPGIDLLGVMESLTPDLLETLAKNEAIKVATSLRSSLAKQPVNA